MSKKIIIVFLGLFFSLHAAEDVYFVVVAGGIGERLWPLSRRSLPKQFLSVDGKRSLLEMALDRSDNIFPRSHKFVATTQSFEQMVKDRVGNQIDGVLVEPALRNTGPAICLAAARIAQKNPDAVVAFLAADHFIQPVDKFREALKMAVDHARQFDEIVLLGIKPAWPATGYGYIKLGEKYVPRKVMNVVSFHEKPSLERAKEYLSSGSMVWNGSYFCAKAKVFLEEFAQHAPDIMNGIEAFVAGKGAYEDLPNIAVDVAVMEKSRRLKAVLLDTCWSDVGDLAIFLGFKNQFDKTDKIISLNSDNNLAFSKSGKQIILLGVKDLCVVETDDAIVVSNQSSVNDIKNALGILKTEQTLLL
jgi:mannose-1-phosphate guanylyltransferase